ncbi:MAG: TauD/TfdA family dioxygenase, partial [Pseudomonadota bacterium]
IPVIKLQADLIVSFPNLEVQCGHGVYLAVRKGRIRAERSVDLLAIIPDGHPGFVRCEDRMRRQQINRSLGANATLSDRQINAMAALDLEIGKAHNQIRLKLDDGDLLFLNNRKVLHGRTALPSDSRRLLFRFRARIPGGL